MVDRKKVIKGLETHIKPNSRCVGCPYPNNGLCGDQLYHDALTLLKEHDQRTGHWIFESQHYEAWSHTCSECGKRMTTGMGTYASYCWNCGAKMTGGEENG